MIDYITLHGKRDFSDVIKATNQLAVSSSKEILSGWAWHKHMSPLNLDLETQRFGT